MRISNTFTTLVILEMNENLIERFSRSKRGHHTTHDKAEIWLLPQKLNDAVREYYQPARKPAEAGRWLDRPEMPNPTEVLDTEEGGSSSSDIVEIVPNRLEGAWESKGMASS